MDERRDLAKFGYTRLMCISFVKVKCLVSPVALANVHSTRLKYNPLEAFSMIDAVAGCCQTRIEACRRDDSHDRQSNWVIRSTQIRGLPIDGWV